MENLINGLVIASVSGAGFLAYKHPRAYAAIAIPGLIAASLLLFGSVRYTSGYLAGFKAGLENTKKVVQSLEDGSEFNPTYPDVPVENHYIWIILIIIGLALLWLRWLIEKTSSKRSEGDEE